VRALSVRRSCGTDLERGLVVGFCEQGDDPSTVIQDVELYGGGKERGPGGSDNRVLRQAKETKR
jgi:hypothetical protein